MPVTVYEFILNSSELCFNIIKNKTKLLLSLIEKTGAFLLITSGVECFSRTWRIVCVSFCPLHSLLLEPFLGFWRVDICGIFIGTLDLACPEESPLLSQGPACRSGTEATPPPCPGLCFGCCGVGLAGWGKGLRKLCPAAPSSCDFSTVGLSFFPALLSPALVHSLYSPAVSSGPHLWLLSVAPIGPPPCTSQM